MKKYILIIFFTIYCFNVCGKFIQGERPVWAINSDTAYTLEKEYWVIDVSGPVTYGLTDRIAVGTIFWFWYEKMPNFYCKINLLQENENTPAISILNKILPINYKNIIFYSSTSFVFSKQTSKNIFLTVDFTIHTLDLINIDENKSNFIIDIMKQIAKDKKANIITTINVSMVYNMSNSSRFLLEASINLYDYNILYEQSENTVYFQDMLIYSGLGFEWALGENYRLKLSILGSFFVSYIPYANFSIKFK